MNTTNILEYLSMISNKNLILNIGMHILVLASIAAIYLLKNTQIKRLALNFTLLALFISVTVIAIIYGNPFHTVTFGIMTLMSGFVLIKDKSQPGISQKGLMRVIPFIFILIGIWYPEFVKAGILEYFIVSPVGIVPCPTLITALGLMNLIYPEVNKKQFITIVFFGIVYGFIGTFKLGVYLDISLIAVVIYSICNMAIRRDVNGNKYFIKLSSADSIKHSENSQK